MADKQNGNIDQGFLWNFEQYVMVYNIAEKKEEKKSKEEVDSMDISGSYVIKNNHFFALYDVEDQVYFKFDNDIYNMKSEDTVFTCKNIDDNRRVFKIEMKEGKTKEIVYERQKAIGFDCWNEEDDVDFFAWSVTQYKKMN